MSCSPGLDTSHKVILYLEDISVSFDGFKALNKLTLAIDAGELRCIIGPNGAGKTTMMDVITGKTRPDSGTCFFGQTIDLTRMTEPRSRTPASAASSRSRPSSRTTRCSRTSNWR
jgi:urea transport system ATP-binding protein